MNRETAGFKAVAQLGAYGGVGEKKACLAVRLNDT